MTDPLPVEAWLNETAKMPVVGGSGHGGSRRQPAYEAVDTTAPWTPPQDESYGMSM